MAQTKNLVVTSLQERGDKVFIRIGDSQPDSTSTNSSAIEFLQDCSVTFTSSNTQSAFRIRHDSQQRDLIFQCNNSNNQTIPLLTLSDDGYITFNGTTTFQDIQFDEITGSALYIGSGSKFSGSVIFFNSYGSVTMSVDSSNRLLFNNSNGISVSSVSLPISSSFNGQYLSIQNGTIIKSGQTQESFASAEGTRNQQFQIGVGGDSQAPTLTFNHLSTLGTIYYVPNQFVFNDTVSTPALSDVQYINGTTVSSFGGGGGSSWKSVQRISQELTSGTEYTVYTNSISQTITNFEDLSVFINDSLLLGKSTAISSGYDYQSGSSVNKIKFAYTIPYSDHDNIFLTYVYNGGT